MRARMSLRGLLPSFRDENFLWSRAALSCLLDRSGLYVFYLLFFFAGGSIFQISRSLFVVDVPALQYVMRSVVFIIVDSSMSVLDALALASSLLHLYSWSSIPQPAARASIVTPRFVLCSLACISCFAQTFVAVRPRGCKQRPRPSD